MSTLMVLYRNGEEWQRIRQAVAPKVMRPKVLEENIDDFNSVAQDAIERLIKIKVTSGQDGEVPDLEGELKKWSTESRYTGLQVNSQSSDIGQPKFAYVQKNPNCVQTRCANNFFIANHFTVR